MIRRKQKTSSTARPSKVCPRPGDELPTGEKIETVYRSKAWLDAVRNLPNCVLCGRFGVQAAHRNEGKGMAMKTDDCLTAALCQECHSDIDNGPTMKREERHAEMDRAIVLTLQALVLAGKVGVL